MLTSVSYPSDFCLSSGHCWLEIFRRFLFVFWVLLASDFTQISVCLLGTVGFRSYLDFCLSSGFCWLVDLTQISVCLLGTGGFRSYPDFCLSSGYCWLVDLTQISVCLLGTVGL